MDIVTFDQLVPFAAAILVGGFIGWLSYRHKMLSIVSAFVITIGVALFGKDLMPSLNRRIDGLGDLPDLFLSAVPQMAWIILALGLVSAVMTRVLTAYVTIHIIGRKDETRRDMRTRLYKDFSYNDDLTRAMQSRTRSTEDVVIPWFGGQTEPGSHPTSRTRRSLRSFLPSAD